MLGTGIRSNASQIGETKLNVDSALQCQKHCKAEQNCKLFNWNSISKKCHLRSSLPKQKDHVVAAAAAVVGAKDCSNIKIFGQTFFRQSKK